MAGKRGAGKGAAKGAARPIIIIRREEIIESGHHGGAWKVAYADFVTAMMAFFLLMWLINATTADQRRGIAAYFSPMAKIENGFSASGMVPGGASPDSDGAQLIDQGPAQLATLEAHADASKTDNDGDPDSGNAEVPHDGPSGTPAATPAPTLAPAPALSQTVRAVASTMNAARNAAAGSAEDKSLRETAQGLRDAVSRDPELAAVAGQMAIDVTPDGLRIQIMDAEHRPMFESGSSVPTERATMLLRVAAHFIAGLPEPVAIGGYTDAAPYRAGRKSNWSLSSGRADASRDLLVAAGLSDARLSNVTGYADRKLLLPADPLAPANRRIVLTLQRVWPRAPAAAVQ